MVDSDLTIRKDLTMNIDYESTQFVEIVSHWGSREVEFVIGFECTSPRILPSFDPMYGGDPGSDAEFDMVNIAYLDEEGNSIEENGSYSLIFIHIIKSFLGEDLYNSIIEAAYEDASNNYYPGE